MTVPLSVSSLEVSCESNGQTKLRVNVTCFCIEDVDDLAAWLELAKTLIVKWEEIRNE
jgi:hypothetical protein